MSYVNQDLLKKQKQRHSVTRVTPEEAVKAANEVADKANRRISEIKALANKQTAEFEAWADHCELQAKIAWEENRELRVRVVELEAEVSRLRKKVSRKSGKRKGEEYEEEG